MTSYLRCWSSSGGRRDAAERAQAMHDISCHLRVQPQARITMVFYPDAETKFQDTGHTGHGWAYGITLMAELVYPARVTVDSRVQKMAADLWPLEELLHFTEIGSAQSRPRVSYPQATSAKIPVT
ncbi:MAG: hypothetical protein ACOX4G_14870 [Limnochordia bacterium]|jgi:hypothetical protein